MDYNAMASDEDIAKTVAALKERNIEAEVVDNKEQALQKIKDWIPADASVMNGASRTLEEIGYIDYLKSGKHGWKNLHEIILQEKDPAKQAQLRRESVLSDYYLGSVHGLAQTGELVIASNTGSQMPHIVYTSPNIIFVVSAKKIEPTLDDALDRLHKHVVPLEDERMKKAAGVGTHLSKTLIFHYESPYNKRRVRMIIVKEPLGF